MREKQRQLRAVLAVRSADVKRRPDDAELKAARDAAARDYYTEALARHIESVVAKAPPLTEAQRARLARLLLVGAA
jgi:hypothetical protein